MGRHILGVPFGLLFEQWAPAEPQLPSIYDEAADLSYVRALDDGAIPYVEARGPVATGTCTRAQAEIADQDEVVARPTEGTITITKAEAESSDRD